MATRVQYGPLGSGQLVGQSIESYRRLVRELLVPGLILLLPSLVVTAVAVGVLVERLLHDHLLIIVRGAETSVRINPGGFLSISLVTLGVLLVLLLGEMLICGATAVVVTQAYIDQPVSWRAAISVVGRRLGSLLSAFGLIALLYIAVEIPEIVLGVLTKSPHSSPLTALSELANLFSTCATVYLGVSFVIVSAVIVLEGATARVAMRRSRQLMRGRFWAAFGSLVLTAAVVAIGWVALALVTGLLLDLLAPLAIVGAFFAFVLLLLFPVTATVIYLDLRNRHGGLDLAETLESLGSSSTWTTGAGQAGRARQGGSGATRERPGIATSGSPPASGRHASGGPRISEVPAGSGSPVSPGSTVAPDPALAGSDGAANLAAPGRPPVAWPLLSPKPSPRPKPRATEDP